MSESADLAIGIPYYAAALGYAYLLAGRTPEALPLLERASKEARSQVSRLLPTCLVWLAEVYLDAGHTLEAAATATEALTLARKRQQRGDEAYALRVRAEISARGDSTDVDQTETHYRETLTLAIELAMRPLVAHCHLGLGKPYRRASATKRRSISRRRRRCTVRWA